MSILAKIFLYLLRFFFSFLFVLCLSSFIVVWSLVDFTRESNIKPLITDIFYDLLSHQVDASTEEQIRTYISSLCSRQETVETTLEGVAIKISCRDFFVAKDLKRFIAESIATSFYGAEYGCQFIECLKEGRYDVLITRKGNEFYQKVFLPLIFLSTLFGLAFFMVEEGKLSKKIRGIAVLILLVCLPGIMVKFLVDPIKQRFISHSHTFDKIVENLLDTAIKKYLIAFIIGISLLVISFLVWLIELPKLSLKINPLNS